MLPELVKTYPFIDTWRSTGYQYYIIPKNMLEAGTVFGLGIDEVVLYNILLDRTKLSYKNKWFDHERRIYIIYPREDGQFILLSVHGYDSSLSQRLLHRNIWCQKVQRHGQLRPV